MDSLKTTQYVEQQLVAQPQDITKPLTKAAAFLVLSITDSDEAYATAKSVVASTADLIKDVAFRAFGKPFSVNVGIGSNAWERLTGTSKPAELHPFKEFKGEVHQALATPGDLLYHIRADSPDLVVEFQKLLFEEFGDAVRAEDAVAGFSYFDARDLLEFVDGTANPVGLDLERSVLVGDEDPDHVGGSYVVVQKYVHDLSVWRSYQTEKQQDIIGRTKFDNVELPDAGAEEQKSHKTLCTITDEDGEHDITRDNMPFATPAKGEYGTYFIGYSRRLWVTEKMLERMFIGDPVGKYDRILDVSTAKTGVTFFCPSRTFLDAMGD